MGEVTRVSRATCSLLLILLANRLQAFSSVTTHEPCNVCYSWEDGIGLILRGRYVSVDKGTVAINSPRTFVKVHRSPANARLRNHPCNRVPGGHTKSQFAADAKRSRIAYVTKPSCATRTMSAGNRVNYFGPACRVALASVRAWQHLLTMRRKCSFNSQLSVLRYFC